MISSATMTQHLSGKTKCQCFSKEKHSLLPNGNSNVTIFHYASLIVLRFMDNVCAATSWKENQIGRNR